MLTFVTGLLSVACLPPPTVLSENVEQQQSKQEMLSLPIELRDRSHDLDLVMLALNPYNQAACEFCREVRKCQGGQSRWYAASYPPY